MMTLAVTRRLAPRMVNGEGISSNIMNAATIDMIGSRNRTIDVINISNAHASSRSSSAF